MDAAPGDPDPLSQVGGRDHRLTRRTDVRVPRRARHQVCERRFGSLPAVGAEIVDGRDFGQTRAQANNLAGDLPVVDRARLAGEVLVIGIANRIEQGSHVRVSQATDQRSLQNDGLTPALGDLTQQVVEQSCRVVAKR